MHFYNIDFHISVIEDLKWIFKDLGHEITNCSLSGHGFVFGRKRCIPPAGIFTNCDWLVRDINDVFCENFYHDNKETLSNYDGFITTYPPFIALLYEKFNKPIIMHIPIRYETPCTLNEERWMWFDDKCRNMIDGGQLIVTANNKCDKTYFEYYVKRPVKHVPSLCDYNFPKRRGDNNKFLLWNNISNVEFGPMVEQCKHPYSWQDISKYMGIVHIPYNISTMSIFEHYTSNMPLIFPSKSFILDLYRSNSALSQLTWNKTSNTIPLKTRPINDINDMSNVEFLVSFADFYDLDWMPYITYFDSFKHLSEVLVTNNYTDISLKMALINIKRKQFVYSSWQQILNKFK